MPLLHLILRRLSGLSYGFGIEEASRIGQAFVPGLPILPSGTERYTVIGGGSQSVKIAKGDRIQIIDREGLQPGEVVLFDSNGVGLAGYLGSNSKTNAIGLLAITQGHERSARRLQTVLQRLGCDLASAEAIKIFEDSSPSGNTVIFEAECDGVLIVAAPGEKMQAFGWMNKYSS